MNAAEINTELHKVLNRAITEGIGEKKVSFETVIGLIEAHKYQLFEWRAMKMFEAAQQKAQAKQPPIILPGMNGFQAPPRG